MRELIMGQTIKSRLRLLSLGLILLPPALSLGFFAVYALSYLQDRAYESLRHVLEYDKGFIERWMDERRSDVIFLSSLPVVQRQDLPAMDSVFKHYASTHEDVTGVVFMDVNGVNVVDTASSQRVNVRDRDYFKAAQEGRPYVSDIFVGRTSGKPIIIFAAPVHVAGEFRGVVVTPVWLDTVDALLNTLRVGRQGSVALLDRNGTWYAGKSHSTKSSFITADAFEDALKSSSAVSTVNAKDQRALAATLVMNEGKWVLAGQLPLSEVLQEYTTFLLMAFMGGVLTLAIVTPFLLRLIRSLERPMHELAELASGMAEGRFSASCPLITQRSNLWEVRILTDAFCRMQEMVGESLETLTRISITDQLTSLANRRHLMDEGRRMVDMCLRGKADCVCIMADVDHFKRINDTWGHQVGDEALKMVAGVFQKTCRGSDLVARFGGEEFVVVAPNAGLRQGVELAERLRQAVSALELRAHGERVSMTMSFGVADCAMHGVRLDPLTAETVLEDALRRADAALYVAKQQGRNRVTADQVL